MSAAETLGVLVELVPADAGARWLDVACGPGLVSRALAPRVGSVLGVDLTPAMVEKAARGRRGRGDRERQLRARRRDRARPPRTTRFDGAITRFSLHHIPAPGRVLEEMARVVRPGGCGRRRRPRHRRRRRGGRLAPGDRAPARPHPLGLPDASRGCGRWARRPASSLDARAGRRIELDLRGVARARLRRRGGRRADRPAAGRAPPSGELPRRRGGRLAAPAPALLALALAGPGPELAQGEDGEGVRPGSGVVEGGMPVRASTRSGSRPAGVAARRRSASSAQRLGGGRRARRGSRRSRRSARSRGRRPGQSSQGMMPKRLPAASRRSQGSRAPRGRAPGAGTAAPPRRPPSRAPSPGRSAQPPPPKPPADGPKATLPSTFRPIGGVRRGRCRGSRRGPPGSRRGCARRRDAAGGRQAGGAGGGRDPAPASPWAARPGTGSPLPSKRAAAPRSRPSRKRATAPRLGPVAGGREGDRRRPPRPGARRRPSRRGRRRRRRRSARRSAPGGRAASARTSAAPRPGRRRPSGVAAASQRRPASAAAATIRRAAPSSRWTRPEPASRSREKETRARRRAQGAAQAAEPGGGRRALDLDRDSVAEGAPWCAARWCRAGSAGAPSPPARAAAPRRRPTETRGTIPVSAGTRPGALPRGRVVDQRRARRPRRPQVDHVAVGVDRRRSARRSPSTAP